MTSVAERLAQLTDDELLALAPAAGRSAGWGASGTITVDGMPVFLKRLPLTDAEVAHPRSTKNRFGLPTYYSYGVGSAGFGSWREVLAHEATSGTEGFPRLLHHRVLAREPMPQPLPWTDDEYVAYWNGNQAVGAFLRARNAATSEVWVLLEHLPQMGMFWLLGSSARIGELLTDVFAALDRLADLRIVHFDAHLGNVVTDGERCTLTDFGLAMGEAFDLSASERRFLDRHRHYDRATVLASLAQMYMGALGHQDPRRLAADIDGIDDAPVAYASELRAVFRQYKAPMLYMVEHFARMMRPSKRSRYDDAEVAALLEAAGDPRR